MSAEIVLKDVERTIKKVCADIKKKSGNVGCDKLDSLSKLVNSYRHLYELEKKQVDPLDGTGVDF